MMKLKVKMRTTFALLPFLIVLRVCGYMTVDVNRLLDDKLTGYNKDLRPVMDHTRPTRLMVHMNLISIVRFDEVNQQLVISTIMQLEWRDEFMSWKPQEYGGITNFTTNSRHFWIPSMVLINSVHNLKKIGDGWLDIRLTANGHASYSPAEVFAAICDTDVTYFPFDVHKCYLNFVVWGKPRNEVELQTARDEISTQYFHEHGGWTLENSDMHVVSVKGSWEQFLHINVHLRRKPRFVIVNMLLPIVFMSLLNILSFIIPTESGERVGFSITILLAIAVFLTLVVDDMPNVSKPMAIFGYYLIGVLFLSCSITITTLISLTIYYKNEKEELSRFWKVFVKIFLRKRSRVSPKKLFGDQVQMSDESKPKHEVECAEAPVELCMDDSSSNVSWADISRKFDSVCLIVSLIVLVVSTVTFFSVVYSFSS